MGTGGLLEKPRIGNQFIWVLIQSLTISRTRTSNFNILRSQFFFAIVTIVKWHSCLLLSLPKYRFFSFILFYRYS